MYTGPHIIKDGLVFGYDTGYGVTDNSTATRFYPGKPTSNALETEANWIYIGANITNPADYPVALPAEVDFQKGASQGSISWSDACRNYADSYPAGTKITVSGWHMFYSTDTSLTMNSRDRLGWHYNKDGVSTYGGTIYTATQWNKWYYFSGTFSSTGVTTNLRVEDGGADYYRSSEDAAKTTQYYCNLQIEVGTDIVSPYVLGTRSSTASLIDLKETASIDLSNVSFDSTGQPTFDGSNDKIVVPNQISTGSYTYETVVKISSSDSSYSGFGSNFKSDSSGYSGVGNGWVIRLDPDGGLQVYTKNNSTTLLNPINISGFRAANVNKYIHLVYTYSNGTNKLYLNGVLQATGTGLSGTTPSDSTLIIGAYSWGISSQTYYINAHQPIAKLYDQTYTATEIKQNFNAYKNRFSI